MKKLLLAISLMSLAVAAQAQKNAALAPTPPMGWNSWNWFGKPDITEEIVRQTIDAMVENGYRDAGYNYVVIDGGWRDTALNAKGELVANPARFPGGIEPLVRYAHSKGLKLGLHIVPGTADCGGDKVGSMGREELHLAQFQEWGVNFLKIDLCRYQGGWNEELIESTYRKWSGLLNDTGILFSISVYKFRPWYPEVCNMARTTYDMKCRSNGGAVFDSKARGSVMSIATLNNEAAAAAGNGYWNDPDMLAVGSQGLALGEEKAHYALWCVMTSPLMLGNDVRNTTLQDRYLLLNRECIAVNQDPTGQGTRVWQSEGREIWMKRLADGRCAILMLNRSATPADIALDFAALGLPSKLELRDLYEKKDLGHFAGTFVSSIPGRDCLFLIASAG